MAIKKYTPTGSGYNDDVTALAAWINENKDGTALENATIGTNTAQNMYISIGDTTINVYLRLSSGSASAVTFSVGGDVIYSLTVSSEYLSKSRVVLCKGGAIFKAFVRASHYTLFAITLDADGKLCLITPKLNEGSISNVSGLTALSSDTGDYISSRCDTAVTPITNDAATQITNLIIVTDNGEVKNLPNAYVALKIQFAPSTVNADSLIVVTMNGVDYITDGRLFIADE